MAESLTDGIWVVMRAVARMAARFARWLIRAVTWPARVWWRAFRRSRWPGRIGLAALASVVGLVARLAVAVPWPGYLFAPPFRTVEYAPVHDLKYLRQGYADPGAGAAAEQCRHKRELCATAQTAAARANGLCSDAPGICATVEQNCADTTSDGVCVEARRQCDELKATCRSRTVPAECGAILASQCPAVEETWQGWTKEDRDRFYHHPQGSAQVMLAQLRYSWFVNLEMASGRERFAAPQNMARYGFLTDIDQRPDPKWNPGNLPVGFTKYYDQRVGAELLDFTCSLCHTGELHFQGTAVRVLGGQAMHAITDMKPGQFQAEMMAALLATYLNPVKFARFAHNVIDTTIPPGQEKEFDYDAAKKKLRREFGATIRVLLANAWTDLKHGNYPVFEGYGRTDATQRIANTVFGRHISPDNYRPATAPVSYPQLWDISKFNWVQWEGYASQPMARNVNESLGVGARLDLFDELGAPLPMHLRYQTSIEPDRLHAIERTVAKLQAPAWPEELFGRIDMAKARKGRALFDVNCRHCHGPHVDPADLSVVGEWISYSNDARTSSSVRFKSTYDCSEPGACDDKGRCLIADTCPQRVTCELSRPADPATGKRPAPIELSAQQCLNLQNPQRVATIDGKPVFRLDEFGNVVDLACDPGNPRDPAGCAGQPDHVPEWQLSLLPLRDIGTDRNAALNFANNTYDASRLGWNAQQLRELCLSEADIRSINPKKLSAVMGLNLMSLSIARSYFRDHKPSPEQLMKYMGYGILDFPRVEAARLQNYKSRPLHGIWATPPFLHNGSVRTIYQMISPREERESWYWSGTKEYDPVDLGYRSLGVPGAVRFDTSVTGNANVGHEFRQGCQKNGVIGRYLEPHERREIMEYLKVMDYTPGDVGYEPALCRDVNDKAQCIASIEADERRERSEHPPWGTVAFEKSRWEQHCSDDDLIYGDALPKTPAPDEVWNSWAMAADKTCSIYRKLLESEDTPGDH